MDAEMAAVLLEDVTKTYGTVNALDHLSLAVAPGQIFGLIGPSGCGKTTLVRLVVGVLEPTTGEVRVLGKDPRHLRPAERERLGYTPQRFFLYPSLTVKENANFVAGLFGLSFRRRHRRIRQVLEFLELWDARDRLARDLSGGMQRRLALATALLHQPSLLLVDEPTAGLDPVLRRKIWDYLSALRDEGTTIVVTTQYIDEAIYCDNVAVMAEGRVLACAPPEELRQRAMGGELLDVRAENLGREEVVLLRQMPGVREVRWVGADTLRMVVADASTLTPQIIDRLETNNSHVVAVEPFEATFDEVFMHIVEQGGLPDSGADQDGQSTDRIVAYHAQKPDSDAQLLQ